VRRRARRARDFLFRTTGGSRLTPESSRKAFE
jgi:hypothetical protein